MYGKAAGPLPEPNNLLPCNMAWSPVPLESGVCPQREMHSPYPTCQYGVWQNVAKLSAYERPRVGWRPTLCRRDGRHRFQQWSVQKICNAQRQRYTDGAQSLSRDELLECASRPHSRTTHIARECRRILGIVAWAPCTRLSLTCAKLSSDAFRCDRRYHSTSRPAQQS
jgi:hypothetical protein